MAIVPSSVRGYPRESQKARAARDVKASLLDKIAEREAIGATQGWLLPPRHGSRRRPSKAQHRT
jgi:hypothetical protein